MTIGPLVLIVDDHADTRELFRFVVESKGYRVIEGTNGQEACDLALTNHPDLILMDTNLPQVDGLMATRRIREISVLCNVPILFVSGHAEPKHRALAIAAGGDDYFVKPVRLSELERAIDRYLKRSEMAAVDQTIQL